MSSAKNLAEAYQDKRVALAGAAAIRDAQIAKANERYAQAVRREEIKLAAAATRAREAAVSRREHRNAWKGADVADLRQWSAQLTTFLRTSMLSDSERAQFADQLAGMQAEIQRQRGG